MFSIHFQDSLSLMELELQEASVVFHWNNNLNIRISENSFLNVDGYKKILFRFNKSETDYILWVYFKNKKWKPLFVLHQTSTPPTICLFCHRNNSEWKCSHLTFEATQVFHYLLHHDMYRFQAFSDFPKHVL